MKGGRWAPLIIVAVALAFLLPGVIGATVRVLTINTALAQPAVTFGPFDGNPIKVFDINEDGRQEIIAQNDNQYVYVFDSVTGRKLAEMRTTFPGGWTARSFNGPEAMKNGDGKVHIVVANSAAYITSYRYDNVTSNATNFVFVKEWERRVNDCYSGSAMDSKPVLADLDRDGHFEILAATENLGLYALRHDGRIYWKNCLGGGNAEPNVADLNRDGWSDVVFGSDGGVVSALDGRTGSYMWTYRALDHFDLHSASMPVGVAVGQLDGLLGPDIVVGLRDSHDPDNWSADHSMLLALNSAGQLLWARQDDNGNPLTYTRAIIVDADNTGGPEVYWADWNTIGHKPPANEEDAWATTGPANFYRYDAQGNLVWRQELGTFWSNKDIPIADIDGDGVQEILANGPDASGHDGIWFLDSRTGAKESFLDLYPHQMQRAPVVADLWGNGTMQFVLGAAPFASSAGGHAVLVYDTGKPYNASWPGLPHPVLGTPVPPPPPPAGYFNATFRIKSPNAWWQELTVIPSPARTITKAEVRVNDGIWRPMTKASWGAWTSSYSTPAGAKVEFLASDANNFVSQSAPFTWLNGVLEQSSVPPSAPPPPPDTFTATFEVAAGSNEWWVDAKVRASDPLAGVDVRLNTGSWTALTATSWDTWAKSIHVTTGTPVTFRATSLYGSVVTSPTFYWLQSGPATFNATFQAVSQTNNWWVEARVTANAPVTKVEASVNSGNWTDLPATNWGTWAKSFFVADGASVRFRATNDVGNTVISNAYTWG